MLIHQDLLQELHFSTSESFESLSLSRYFPHLHGRFIFTSREFAMLNSPTGRLNDVCINGIGALLQQQFSEPTRKTSSSSQNCTLFSTFDLSMMQYKAGDAEVWRRTKQTEYWARDIWILPIHRAQTEHWTMSTIIPSTGHIYLFDSFGQHHPWKSEIQVCNFLC